MQREKLCFPPGTLLFSHNDARRATFLPAKISSAPNPGSQTCLWLFCSRGRNCSSAQLQNFSSPRLWASLTSVPVWAIKIPFNNQHSPVWEAYSIILSKDPRLPWCFLAIFLIEAGLGLSPEEMHVCPPQTLPRDPHMENGTFQGDVDIKLPTTTPVYSGIITLVHCFNISVSAIIKKCYLHSENKCGIWAISEKKNKSSFLVIGKLSPVLYIFNSQLWHLFYPDYSDFLEVFWWEILEETFILLLLGD